MEQPQTQQLHVIQSSDWKDAVITVLAPASPYRPWRTEAVDISEGDLLLFAVSTDPPSIVTAVGALRMALTRCVRCCMDRMGS